MNKGTYAQFFGLVSNKMPRTTRIRDIIERTAPTTSKSAQVIVGFDSVM